MVHSYRSGLVKWVPRKILSVLGPVLYLVKVPDHATRRCHIDQLRGKSNTSNNSEANESGVENSTLTSGVPDQVSI